MEKQNGRLKSEAQICSAQLKKHLDSQEKENSSNYTNDERETLLNTIESQKNLITQLSNKCTSFESEIKSLKAEKIIFDRKCRKAEGKLTECKNKQKSPSEEVVAGLKVENGKLKRENTSLKCRSESAINNLADKKNKDIMKKLADMTNHQSRMESKMKEILDTVKTSPGVASESLCVRKTNAIARKISGSSDGLPQKRIGRPPAKRKQSIQIAHKSDSDSDLESIRPPVNNFKRPVRISTGDATVPKKRAIPVGYKASKKPCPINAHLSNSGSSSDNDIDLVGQLENSFKSPVKNNTLDESVLVCDPLPMTSNQFNIFNNASQSMPPRQSIEYSLSLNVPSKSTRQPPPRVQSIFDLMTISGNLSPLQETLVSSAKFATFVNENSFQNSIPGTPVTVSSSAHKLPVKEVPLLSEPSLNHSQLATKSSGISPKDEIITAIVDENFFQNSIPKTPVTAGSSAPKLPVKEVPLPNEPSLNHSQLATKFSGISPKDEIITAIVDENFFQNSIPKTPVTAGSSARKLPVKGVPLPNEPSLKHSQHATKSSGISPKDEITTAIVDENSFQNYIPKTPITAGFSSHKLPVKAVHLPNEPSLNNSKHATKSSGISPKDAIIPKTPSKSPVDIQSSPKPLKDEIITAIVDEYSFQNSIPKTPVTAGSVVPKLPVKEVPLPNEPSLNNSKHTTKSFGISPKDAIIPKTPAKSPVNIQSSPETPTFQPIYIKNEKRKTKLETRATVLTVGPVSRQEPQRAAHAIVSTLGEMLCPSPTKKFVSMNVKDVEIKNIVEVTNLPTLNSKSENLQIPILNNTFVMDTAAEFLLSKNQESIDVKPFIETPPSSGDIVENMEPYLPENGVKTSSDIVEEPKNEISSVILSEESMLCAFEMDVQGQSSQSEGETQSDSTIEADWAVRSKHAKKLARMNKLLTIDSIFEKSDISFAVPKRHRTRTSTSQKDLADPSDKTLLNSPTHITEDIDNVPRLRRSSRKSSQSQSDASCSESPTTKNSKARKTAKSESVCLRNSNNCPGNSNKAEINHILSEESGAVINEEVVALVNEVAVVNEKMIGNDKNSTMPYIEIGYDKNMLSNHVTMPENDVLSTSTDDHATIECKSCDSVQENSGTKQESSLMIDDLVIFDDKPDNEAARAAEIIVNGSVYENGLVNEDILLPEINVDENGLTKILYSDRPRIQIATEVSTKVYIAPPTSNWFTAKELDLDLTPISKKPKCAASAVSCPSVDDNDISGSIIISSAKQSGSRKRKKNTAPKASKETLNHIFELFMPVKRLSKLVVPVENNLSIAVSDNEMEYLVEIDSGGSPSCASSVTDKTRQPIASVDLDTLHLIQKPAIPPTTSVDDEPLNCTYYEDYSHITQPHKISNHFINLFRKNLCTSAPNVRFLVETILLNHRNKCLQNIEGKLVMVIKNEIAIRNSSKDGPKPPVDVLVEFFFDLFNKLENSDYDFFKSGALKRMVLKAYFAQMTSMKRGVFSEPLISMLTFAIQMSLKCQDLSYLRSYVINVIMNFGYQFVVKMFTNCLNNYNILFLIGKEQLSPIKGSSSSSPDVKYLYLAGLEFYLRFSQIKVTPVEQLSYIHQFAVEHHLINCALDALSTSAEQAEDYQSLNSQVSFQNITIYYIACIRPFNKFICMSLNFQSINLFFVSNSMSIIISKQFINKHLFPGSYLFTTDAQVPRLGMAHCHSFSYGI